ncbi:hypothetical protein VTI74DRAFT_11461 [Chaetomium olivicolor]
MKYTTALLGLATLAAAAPDLSIFPSCSLECITSAVPKSTKCELTDFACVCKNMDAVKSAATPCVVEKCGVDVAINQVLPATEKFCKEVGSGGGSGSGSSSAPPAASSPSSAPPAATSSSSQEQKPTKTGTSTAPEPTDDEDEPEHTSTGNPSSFITAGPTASSAPTKTGSGTKPTSSVATGGAAGKVVGLGMAVLGAVAAL